MEKVMEIGNTKTNYEPHGDLGLEAQGIKELISCVVKVTASQDIG